VDLGIKNKTAIVFGAGSGLGRAMAISLAREGVQLALCGRTLSNLEETQAMIQKLGGKSICVSWDLANRAVINSNFERIEKELGPIDILINNTGGPPPTTAAGQTAELWLDKFQEMVLSIFMITDRALIGMRDRQWGRILTSTSSGAIAPIPNLAISNILRASLHAWSKTLSRELAPQGITSNIIVPGRIAADRIRFLDESRAKRENKPIEAIMEDGLKGIPIGRLGTADEYGDVAAFLVSKNASYITGSVVRVDGGQINSI